MYAESGACHSQAVKSFYFGTVYTPALHQLIEEINATLGQAK